MSDEYFTLYWQRFCDGGKVGVEDNEKDEEDKEKEKKKKRKKEKKKKNSQHEAL